MFSFKGCEPANKLGSFLQMNFFKMWLHGVRSVKLFVAVLALAQVGLKIKKKLFDFVFHVRCTLFWLCALFSRKSRDKHAINVTEWMSTTQTCLYFCSPFCVDKAKILIVPFCSSIPPTLSQVTPDWMSYYFWI